ncbi:lumenal Hsp70 protein [Bachmanniomyces sp. S44760]|nr:lumenal Hsp70 protein [Bachmanniomyces sp. S44760]
MPPHGRRRWSTFVLCASLVFLFASTASAASAVLGIDLGSEYIKAALVKPGIPLEIVLTKDSRRKEAATVAFKPSNSKSTASEAGVYPERVYGADAVALTARYPGDVYSNLKPLLGEIYKGSSIVATYGARRPELKLVGDKERGTVAFKSRTFGTKEEAFMVEELLAMEFQNIKANAAAFAGKGSTIRDVVITIPAFYTATEKRAVELAADLAGLKVLGLITDGLSVGLNYATSRTFPSIGEGGKAEYHLVYDMGAGSVTATVLRFQGRTVKDVGRYNKTVQEVQILGVGWDKILGGDTLNEVIMQDMISKFVETSRIKSMGVEAKHVLEHGRTTAKLWKEAERLRQVLSANSETSASFEGLLYDDVTFKYKLSRTEFEKLASAFAEQVQKPILQALEMAKLEFGDLESIILHGGAVRTPFVQKQLEALVGSADKIRTNVNSDEAAVFGAAFKAAGISPSFRVKEIRAGDIAGYSAGVSWESDGKERQQKLFIPSSQAGQQKLVPFKKTDDFTFTLYQQIPQANDQSKDVPIAQITTTNLTASVKELVNKFGCSTSDISLKFGVRLSKYDGLPEIVQGTVSCEVADNGKKGNVVDGVKDFFGFGSKKAGDQEPLKEDSDDLEISSSTAPAVSTTSTSSTSPSKSSSAKSSETGIPEKEDGEPGKRTETRIIGFTTSPAGIPAPSPKQLERIVDRLSTFDASDRSRLLREEALNTLEAYTYKARDLLSDEGFITASTEVARTEIEEKFKLASEWLYGDGADATREILKARLKELRELVDPIQKRKDEASKRPEEIQSLREALNSTASLINMLKEQNEKASAAVAAAAAAASASSSSSSSSSSASTNTSPSSSSSTNVIPEDDDDLADLDESPPDTTSSSSSTTPKSTETPNKIPEMPTFSNADIASVQETHSSIQSWLEEKILEQEKLSPSDDPAFTGAELMKKSQELNSVFERLIRESMNMKRDKGGPVPPKGEKKKAKSSTKSSTRSKSAKGKSGSTSSSTSSKKNNKGATKKAQKTKKEESDKGDPNTSTSTSTSTVATDPTAAQNVESETATSDVKQEL